MKSTDFPASLAAFVWVGLVSSSAMGSSGPERFQSLVRTESWSENWSDAEGALEPGSVTAEIWTEAIQAALDRDDAVHLPARELPYYIDAPLLLRSGQHFSADPGTEIRLKPGSNCCMIRNRNVIGFPDQSVPETTNPDTDITISGGIWTTLAVSHKESNGNLRGSSSKSDPVPGTHGVILLQNVRRIAVKNITVRQSKAFAVHLANVQDFTIEGITLEGHQRDGVHVNGPASDGVIRGVRGDSRDDTVALNAWEWENYAPSYGAIHDIVVEDITGTQETVPSANSIRLLPGVKRFADGSLLPCPIENVTLRKITDIREFKIYDQPNLERGRDRDHSEGIGSVKNLRFEDLTFHRPGVIELHANADGIALENVTFDFPVNPEFRLLRIGPKSMTYKAGSSDDPARWTEIFSPDLDCTVRNVSVIGVRVTRPEEVLPRDRVIAVIEQKLNPEYPHRTPRGGTGKGIWLQ